MRRRFSGTVAVAMAAAFVLQVAAVAASNRNSSPQPAADRPFDGATISGAYLDGEAASAPAESRAAVAPSSRKTPLAAPRDRERDTTAQSPAPAVGTAFAPTALLEPPPIKETAELLTEQELALFQQPTHELTLDEQRSALFAGLNSANPDVRLAALNDLEPMLAWDAQARENLEIALIAETNPGMRMRMSDLLAKEVSPVLQSATAHN